MLVIKFNDLIFYNRRGRVFIVALFGNNFIGYLVKGVFRVALGCLGFIRWF